MKKGIGGFQKIKLTIFVDLNAAQQLREYSTDWHMSVGETIENLLSIYSKMKIAAQKPQKETYEEIRTEQIEEKSENWRLKYGLQP